MFPLEYLDGQERQICETCKVIFETRKFITDVNNKPDQEVLENEDVEGINHNARKIREIAHKKLPKKFCWTVHANEFICVISRFFLLHGENNFSCFGSIVHDEIILSGIEKVQSISEIPHLDSVLLRSQSIIRKWVHT